jgi:uncharacterized spore protein YtfJ
MVVSGRPKGETMADVDSIIGGAREAITVRRVYGEPYEKNGVTVIPAAAVRGGGGAGEGEQGQNEPSGSGGGFGVIARPVGAYRISDGELTWVPAADTTRVIIMSEFVLVVALLVVRSIFKFRRGD